MYELTGLDSLDWLVLGLIAAGLGLVVLGLWKHTGLLRWSLIGVGVVMAVGGVLAQPARVGESLKRAVTSFPAILILGALLGVVGAVVWLLARRPAVFKVTPVVIAAMVVLVGATVGAYLYVRDARYIPPTPPDENGAQPSIPEPFERVWTLQLTGHPVGLSYHEPTNSVYVTLGEGSVVRLSLSPDPLAKPSDPVPVITDLTFPRGVAAIGSHLYVVEVGDLPCETVFPVCNWLNIDEDVAAGSELAPEAVIIEHSRARILDYSMNNDGTLTRIGPLLSDLPVSNTDHAVNGLKGGPDGELYVSIGHFDSLLYSYPDFGALQHPNKDLMGTLLRIDPTDGSYEVVATGLRNVFGITLDPTGVVWGVDNDGGSLRGHRREEVLRIVDGANFGFPFEGSSPPFTVRTDPATYTRNHDVKGSGGTEWIQGVGQDQGLLLGALGGVSFLRLEFIDGVFRVPEQTHPIKIVGSWGWPVAIEKIGTNAALYAEYGPNTISLLTWTSD